MNKTRIINHQVNPEKLVIEWGDGHTSRYHYMWLRDNAPENRHASGQKLIDTIAIPLDLTAKSVAVNGTIQIEWSNDGHVSEFTPEWLRDNSYEPDEIEARRPKKTLWETDTFPTLPTSFSFSQLSADDRHLCNMLASVRDYGFALMGGIPVESESLFKVIDLFGFVRDTNYGPYFDVKVVSNPTNLAFTSATLGAHTDNPYRHPVPTLQLLHVLSNNVDGGDSTLVDGFCVAEAFREQYPEQFAILASTLVTFRFSSDDTDLSHESTIIQTNPRGEVIGIRFNNRSMQTIYVEPEEMTAFYAAYHIFAHMLEEDRFKITFKMGSGDAMLFDNQRVLHGRIGYTSSGDRHLQGCYADIDGLLSKLAVLEREN
ncbi:MAG: gamma-butyrobetaine hydroxylase [Cellvibrionaceae bacterium]|jgi:gamma-butyrobetaine hydroxylase